MVVLTHECDVSSSNEREFNDSVLICPLLTVDALVQEITDWEYAEDYNRAFLGNLASRKISRLLYFPPCRVLPNGGVAYLNQITHTHVSSFPTPAATSCCALSAFGLEELEYVLESHLLREKADRLALAPQ